MPEAEITINCSPKVIWSFFIEPKNWNKWENGVIKDAQWRKGGKIKWSSGGSSSIGECTPGKFVELVETYKTTTYTFESGAGGKTVVRMESTPSEEVYYSDGGAAELSRLKSCLNKLKKQLESK